MRQDQSTEPEIDTGVETAPLEPFPIVSVVYVMQSEYTQKAHPFTVIHEINIFYITKTLEVIGNKPAVQVADADPSPLKLHPQAKSTNSAKSP